METFKQLWSLPVDKSLEILNSRHEGLTDKEVEERLLKYGKNSFYNKEKKGPFSIFLKQFISPLIFLLIGAATLTGILKEWIDTGVIIFAVLLNVVLGFYHEYHAENTLEKLTTYIKDRSKVIRNGHEQEIDSALVVPGDILKLSYGARIPADARILSVNNLRVDEAILTGESLPIEKNEIAVPLTAEIVDRNNIAHAGTLVVEGYATALVYATGNHTEIGKIAGIVSSVERSETPLQKSVNKLAWFIFIVVIGIVIGILLLGLFRGQPLLPMLILSAAVAVGAVPEALPIALTVILAIGATRIANKKGIIRKLSAAETLGSATLIMTDKTGTLTMADMQLVGIASATSVLEVGGKVLQDDFNEEEKRLLQMSLSNVDVSIENPDEKEDKWNFKGRPFEVNIVKACRDNAISLEKILSASFSLVLPFNSTNKFSVSDNGDFYTVMGAPDILLKKADISKEDYVKMEEWIERTSREGKRLIGLARFKKHHQSKFEIEQVKEIEFLGMLVFFDPIRKEVPKAIKNIESHSMKIVLVTGDLPGTALSVAHDLDWHVTEEEVLVGSDLRKMSDEELLPLIPNIKIFARVTPEDKLRIGTLYQKLGEVVAMTGDGVNDAPSLKAMDIGISLGSGSDVAKSAADLVLLDDNFETISMAIDEGRKILANVRKTFVYLMSNSLDEVFVIGGSLIFNLALPLTALQIIWVNLFTGSLPALSFAFDEDIDKERYSGKDLRLIFTKEVKILTLGIGVLSSLFLFLLYYFLIKIGLPLDVARSIFFVCFSSYILAITLSFRSLRSSIFSYAVFSNKKLNVSLLISLALLIITMTVPFMRETFSLAPMPISWIPFVVFWLILNILLVEGAKYMMRISKKLPFKDNFFTKK
ncbi:MAG: HAD-IC family P-type ATPase [Patescibacteria group bacterium]